MRKHFLLGLCLAAALPACTPTTSEYTETEAPKQIHVDYVRLSHVVTFAPGKAELAKGESEKLMAFLGNAQVGSEDHVYLEPANENQLTASRIGEISREMDRRGVGAQTLPAGLEPGDRMKIIVERYVVTPPDCPNWTTPTPGDHSNQVSSNFGCSDASNLARMVADPRDLVVGRTMGPKEGDQAIAGLTRYRQGKPTPLTASGGFSATGGTNVQASQGGVGAGAVTGQ